MLFSCIRRALKLEFHGHDVSYGKSMERGIVWGYHANYIVSGA